MTEYGGAVSKGIGGASRAAGDVTIALGRWAGDTWNSLDGAVHQVLPAAIPTWLLLGLAFLFVGYLVVRR